MTGSIAAVSMSPMSGEWQTLVLMVVSIELLAKLPPFTALAGRIAG